MARAVGLDIGARSIKVVELGGSAKAPRIQRMAIRQIPPPPAVEQVEQVEGEEAYDPDQIIVDLIDEVFSELQLPKDDVCASVDSGVTIIREITVPFFEDDQIKKIVKFEAENHLHSYAIEDVVVNYIKTGETRDGSRLTIFASPKVDLARRIAILRRAGIEPASVDLDTTSLHNTLGTLGYFEDTPNCIIVDVGAHTTNLMMVTGGEPRVVRSFLLGSGSLEAELESELGLTHEEGRKRVLSHAGPHADDLLVPAAELETPGVETEKSLTQVQTDVVGERRMAFVNKLQREAYRSLVSVRTETPPEKILLLGGGSLIPEVGEQLSERLGLPVEQVNLLDRIESKTLSAEPEYAGAVIGSAIGCGMRMMGARGLGVELLQDEFAPKNTFDVVRTALSVAITLLFLAVLGGTFVRKKQLEAEKTLNANWVWAAKNMFLRVEPAFLNQVENKALQVKGNKRSGEAWDLAQRWLKRQAKDEKQVGKIVTHLKGRHRLLEEKLGQAREIPKVKSALECWVEVYKALSKVPREELGRWFQVTQLSISKSRLQIKIVVSDPVVPDKVQRLLTESEYLKGRAKGGRRFVEPGVVQTLKDGKKRIEFTIKFDEEK